MRWWRSFFLSHFHYCFFLGGRRLFFRDCEVIAAASTSLPPGFGNQHRARGSWQFHTALFLWRSCCSSACFFCFCVCLFEHEKITTGCGATRSNKRCRMQVKVRVFCCMRQCCRKGRKHSVRAVQQLYLQAYVKKHAVQRILLVRAKVRRHQTCRAERIGPRGSELWEHPPFLLFAKLICVSMRKRQSVGRLVGDGGVSVG